MENFIIGCNYWSSAHALYMWREWDEAVIDRDFQTLSDYGINTLRIFPLWPDFQPIVKLYGNSMCLFEYGMNGGPLPETQAGKCGIDLVMMERFDRVVHLAEKHGLRLIVGLLTGWMSGELFVPPALEGLNILTDPQAIKWEIRFVKYFVSHYSDCKTILAWDLGNECNNMSKTANSDEVWLWCNSIADAIRVSDPQSRPVLSGLHGLTLDGLWKIRDQGEICDMLTTHPYPCFTPYCNNDRTTNIRPLLHSTCESLYYSNLSQKPCMIEEIGTITGTLAGDTTSAAFAKTTVYSAWIHNLTGYMWWCNHDYTHIKKPPYEWNILERELGLLRGDNTPKGAMLEIKAFAQFLADFPLNRLPEAETDGYILLGKTEDPYQIWGYGYNSYILSKQAGMNMKFAYINDPIPESRLYVLPCVTGFEFIKATAFDALMQRVYEGAVLYLSLDDPYINGYDTYFGAELLSKYCSTSSKTVVLEDCQLEIHCETAIELKPTTADVIARDRQGYPCLLKNSYGKGVVYLLTYPLENALHRISNVFDTGEYHRIYQCFAPEKPVRAKYKNIGLTRHGNIYAAINYSDTAYDEPFILHGLSCKTLKGDIGHIEPFGTCIFEIETE